MAISVLLTGPRACVDAGLLALAGAPFELLVVTDAPSGASLPPHLLLAGDSPGRAAAWRLAAVVATGDVLVAFDAIALPTVAAVEALAAAVRGGAALAGPAIASANRRTHGYRTSPDGALWPLSEPLQAPDALSLDCLAARPELFRSAPLWDAIAGPYESQLAAHAGTLAIADCTVERRVEGPSLSIVVCTRDRADEILECIDACIALDLAGNDAELIVVDNGSSDGTAALLAGVRAERVQIVHEPVAGLSRARNAGARVAAGELLTFLDDDARPGPGWLEQLRLAFADPGVAIAGGPICGLWPDGRPAGFPPPTAAPYFGVLDRGDAAHDSARPEDGPWGGNWTGRRSLIDELGGFDVRFGAGEGGNLGGEEVHLGWRVLDRGLGRLRFVPGAAVGHRSPRARVNERYVLLRAFRCGIEDVRLREALGRAEAGSIEQAAAHAAARLARLVPPGRRDAEAVLDALASGGLSLEAGVDGAGALGQLAAVATGRGAENVALGAATIAFRPGHAGGRVRPSGAGPEVLVCYPDVPVPSISAGHARAFELLHSLRRIGHQPVLFALGSTGADETIARLTEAGVEVHSADRGARFSDLAARRFPAAIVTFWDIAERLVPALRSVSPGTRTVVDSVDVHFVRLAREAALRADPARAAEAESVRVRELAVYGTADVVLAVSDEEQELLCGLLPGTPVGILPTVHHPLATSQSPDGREGALFVGSYGHAPNVDAVRFLCGEIVPALRALGSSLPVAIAGSNMPDELAALARAAGVEVLGFLPSVEAELARRRLSLAPLRFGAGIKGKVGESLAAGVPVVGTAVAAEGFAGADGAMLVAGDAHAIAEAAIRLAGDDALWQRLSDGGRALVDAQLGPARCDRELADVLDYLHPRERAA